MPIIDVGALARERYNSLKEAYDEFFRLRSQLMSDFDDCTGMATNIRTAFSTFTNDVITLVDTPVIDPAAPGVDFTPLKSTLQGILEDISVAQGKIDQLKTTSAPVTEPVTEADTTVNTATPIVLDGPVLPA
jgi:hypothetical protein